jgi:hypothetical protein
MPCWRRMMNIDRLVFTLMMLPLSALIVAGLTIAYLWC